MSFSTGLRILYAAFQRWDLTPEQLAVWRTLLSDVDPGSLERAASHIARTSKFPPSSPAEWREAALAMDGQGRKLRFTAAEAWDEMYRNRHRCDRSKPATWTSEAVRRAAQAVKWDDPDWTSEQVPTIRAQFERYYNGLADKAEVVESVQATLDLAPAVDRLLGVASKGVARLEERA